jgi:hypothetical protein
MKESAVTRSCLHYLGSLPRVKIWRNHTGFAVFPSGMSVPVGIPANGGGGDFIGFETDELYRVAQFLSVEFKAETGGRTSPKQKAWRDFVEENGGRAVVIDSLETCRKLFPVSELKHSKK